MKTVYLTLHTAQIKGVDSTKRETEVELEAGAKLYVIEKLMTHGSQFAESNMEVRLNGEGVRADHFHRLRRDIQTGIPSEGCGKCEMSGTRTM